MATTTTTQQQNLNHNQLNGEMAAACPAPCCLALLTIGKYSNTCTFRRGKDVLQIEGPVSYKEQDNHCHDNFPRI